MTASGYFLVGAASSASLSPAGRMSHDWIGSPRVTSEVADAIRSEVPRLSYGAEVLFDGVALVDMRGRSVGEWEVLDRISLAGSNCDS